MQTEARMALGLVLGPGFERQRHARRMGFEELYAGFAIAVHANQYFDGKAAGIDERGAHRQAYAVTCEHRRMNQRWAVWQRHWRIERMGLDAWQRRLVASIRRFQVTGAKSIHDHRRVYDRHSVSSS
jgi:hypothetical protein